MMVDVHLRCKLIANRVSRWFTAVSSTSLIASHGPACPPPLGSLGCLLPGKILG